jgi:serine acetyltransferase
MDDLAIGVHGTINLSAIIGHDARIGNYATLAPSVNVSGGAKVGACSIVGAGSVIVDDLPENVTVVGASAHVIKTRAPRWHER